MPIKKIAQTDWPRIAQLRYEGKTQVETAKAMGCIPQTIRLLEHNAHYQVFYQKFIEGIGYEEGRRFVNKT